MINVSLTNFQAFKKADFDIDGFTVVTGLNDLGKSALIRAVTYPIQGQTGDFFIRDGENETSVKQIFNYPSHGLNNREVLWKKKKKSKQLYKDVATGQFFEKYSNIREFDERINVGELKVNDKLSINPQIAQWYDPPFLLIDSKENLHRALLLVFNLSVLSEIDADINSENHSTKVLLSKLSSDYDKAYTEYNQRDLNSAQKQLEFFSSQYEGVYNDLQSLDSFIELDKSLQELEKNTSFSSLVVSTMTSFSDTLTKIADFNDLFSIQKEILDLEYTISVVRGSEDSFKDVEKDVTCLQEFFELMSFSYDDSYLRACTNAVPILKSLLPIIDEYESYKLMESEVTGLNLVEKEIYLNNTLKSSILGFNHQIDIMFDYQNIARVMFDDTYLRSLEQCQSLSQEQVKDLIVFENFIRISSMYQSIGTFTKELLSLEKLSKDMYLSLDIIDNKINSLDNCPLCGK